ncbi:hypothetical protein BFAG_04645 [Bacteroides fragilis 3_1_12]|uniref:Uncharacterized protein n=1 Tax=Bacteroides fragilis 3_1_12 TaxID=457424 RepID=A0ABN0BSU3_BACFG|nr:hypothetical protein BFAG_04645 [Bacteroides fragilis 3_1_12]
MCISIKWKSNPIKLKKSNYSNNIPFWGAKIINFRLMQSSAFPFCPKWDCLLLPGSQTMRENLCHCAVLKEIS